MIDWRNRILTNVKLALGDEVKAVTSTQSDVKAKFPACAVQTIINNSIADDLSADNDSENAVTCGVQIDIFVKTSLSDAYRLADIVNSAMYRMNFIRANGFNETINYTSPDIKRVTARFERIIGSSDVIDRFEE